MPLDHLNSEVVPTLPCLVALPPSQSQPMGVGEGEGESGEPPAIGTLTWVQVWEQGQQRKLENKTTQTKPGE